MATKNRKASGINLFDAPEDNLAAAQSLCAAMSSKSEAVGLDDDEVFYGLVIVSGLIDHARSQLEGEQLSKGASK